MTCSRPASLIALFLFTLVPASLRAQTSAPADTSQYSCRIRPLRSVYRRGEQVAFAVELWNKTDHPRVLAAAVDGSEVGWRSPEVAFEVYRVRARSRKKVEPGLYIRCGNTDAMVPEDFVRVEPGRMMDPCAASRYNPMSSWFRYSLRPGTYAVVFTYSTQPHDEVAWQANADGQTYPVETPRAQAVQALIDQVPALRLRSSPVYLTITR